jgi:hypothetical protein
VKKPDLLRAAITALLPELGRDPDRLAMWVEKGKVIARQGAQRGFAWEYDLIVLISGYAGDPDVIMFTVCEWLRAQQPDLLASGAEGIPFEVDILDAGAVDVQITLSLNEAVTAAPGDAGRWNLATVAQAVPLIPEISQIGPGLTSIWVDGQQVAPRPLD